MKILTKTGPLTKGKSPKFTEFLPKCQFCGHFSGGGGKLFYLQLDLLLTVEVFVLTVH